MKKILLVICILLFGCSKENGIKKSDGNAVVIKCKSQYGWCNYNGLTYDLKNGKSTSITNMDDVSTLVFDSDSNLPRNEYFECDVIQYRNGVVINRQSIQVQWTYDFRGFSYVKSQKIDLVF